VGNASERCETEKNVTLGSVTHYGGTRPVTLGSVTHYDHCIGTYIHGFLDNGPVIEFLLKDKGNFATLGSVAHYNNQDDATLGSVAHYIDPRAFKEAQYDRLADHVRRYVDMERLYQILSHD
jgi:adenosylcobyric acid synthase